MKQLDFSTTTSHWCLLIVTSDWATGHIVTPMMDYDVVLLLVLVYIGLNCASLSVFLVFKAEQSYSQAISAVLYQIFLALFLHMSTDWAKLNSWQ